MTYILFNSWIRPTVNAKANTITTGLHRGVGLSILAISVAACGGGGSSTPTLSSIPAPLPAPLPPAVTYTIGGTISGLNGTVVLQDNGGDDLSVTSNGAFTFATPLANSASYATTVKTQPTSPPQTCSVANGAGTVAAANISNVAIICADIPLAVTSSMPATGATNVERTVTPTIVFTRSVDATTAIGANITLSSSAGSQPITIATSGTQITVTPAATLFPSTSYTLTIGTGVHGSSGELLTSPASITFTTKASTIAAPTLLETDNAGDATRPQIAIDSDGNAIAVWSQHDGVTSRIYYNRYTRTGGWGSATLIGPPVGGTSTTALNPHIAMNANGDALIVWQQTDAAGSGGGVTTYNSRIWNVRLAASGLGSPTTLSVGGVDSVNPQLAMNSAGDAAVVWQQAAQPEVWARRYLSGSWGVPMALQSDFSFGAIAPQVAIAKDGTVTAVWEQSHGTRNHVWANRSAGTAWAIAKQVENNSTISSNLLDPHVATDATGGAIVVWKQVEATAANSDIWSARFVSGAWTTPELLENDSANPATDPKIAMDAAGNAIAIFAIYSGTASDNDLMAARFSVGSGWSAPVLIETDGGNVSGPPQIAMNSTGIAQVVWTQYRNGTRYDVMTNRFALGSGWSTPQLLGHTDMNANQSAYLAGIAINANAAIQSVWIRTDGLRFNVWANGFE